MKPFIVSKNIQPGTICTFSGNKLIRASNRTKKIAGVWVASKVTIIHTTDGVRHELNSPAGLQTFGPVYIQTAHVK